MARRKSEWKRLAATDARRAVREAPPEAARGEWSGTFERWVVDDLDSGTHREVYGLKTGDGLLSLYFSSQVPTAGCAQTLRVRGYRMDNVVAVNEASTEERAVGVACAPLGDQRIAVLMVNLSDASLPANITPAVVRSLYFGAGNTLDSFWREASWGKTSASGDVFGPFNLGITYQCNDNDVIGSSFPILQAAIAAADSQVDFTQYSHVAMIVPDQKFCNVSGFATLGCTDLAAPNDGPFKASRAFIKAGAVSIGSVAHEAGHTLGLNHSGAAYFSGLPVGSLGTLPTPEEYGNPFDTMGALTCSGVATAGHYAAQHKTNLGWLPGSSIQNIESSGVFSFNALESPLGVQALRVRRGVGNNQWLWIEYRAATGFDSVFQSCAYNPYGGVLIYLEDPNLPVDGRTRLLDFGNSLSLPNNSSRKALAAPLKTGQSWTDPYTQLTLQVLSVGSGGATVRVNYDTPCTGLSSNSATLSSAAQSASVAVNGGSGCTTTATSNNGWITVTGGSSFAGNGAVTYSVAANTSPQRRTGSISIGRQTFTVSQLSDNGQPQPVSMAPSSGSSAAGTAQRFRFVFSDPDGAGQLAEVGAVISTASSVVNSCHFSFRTSDRILRLYSDDGGGWAGWSIGADHLLDNNSQCNINVSTTTATASGTTLELLVDVIFLPAFTGAKSVYLNAADTPGANSGLLPMGSWTVNPAGSGAGGLRFVPIVPCRVMDTRAGGGKTGAFGPPSLAASTARTLPVPAGPCGVPSNARAYAINVTVVPLAPLAFLTVWPSGTNKPFVSTLNSFEGRVVANSAIVPAGLGGSIDFWATSATDLVVDVNGYFTDQPTASNLVFYPVTPCRVIDTRAGQGTTGAFGPPSFTANSSRTFAIPQGRCNIPSSAQAYSLNFTVVPPGPLGFLTAWPSGQSRPLVSTLNSFEGRVVANGALIPAGNGAAIDIFSTDTTDVAVDINGYFAPDDGVNGLYLRTLTPCRAVDTRPGQGTSGLFGPPALAGGGARNLPLGAVCGVGSGVRAYSMNVTVSPTAGTLQFLTAWPGGGSQPFVSTLNSFDGRIVANAALVPAGSDGSVNIFVTNPADVIVDLNGYFSR